MPLRTVQHLCYIRCPVSCCRFTLLRGCCSSPPSSGPRRLGWLPPRPLRSVATLALLLLLAHWTWWAAYERYGVTQAAIDSLQQLSRQVLRSTAGGA